MSVFTDLIKGIISPVTGLIDNLHTSDEEKLALKSKMLESQMILAVEMEKAVQSEMDAKRAVLVAELQQGDNYTKRARPTVVYAGLGIALVNHVLLPWVAHFTGQQVPDIAMPVEFWVGWSGIVATWVIGRSAERRGIQNRFISAVTGS